MSPDSIKQPAKKETLIRKQKKRIRRFRLLRGRLPELSPRWWVGVGEVLGITALLLTNIWLLYPFFGQEDRTNLFSAPVIPVLADLTKSLLPFTYGVRLWLLVFLIAFPLSFYYFVREISGRKLAGFLAGFIVSLPISIFLPLRINLGLLGEDGAHIASLTLIPLVCLLLLRFLRQGNFWAGLFSALGTTIVALASPIGVIVLFIFMGVITFSEMLLGRGRIKLVRFLVVFLLAVGFSAFWYNPKFVILTINSPQGQLIRKTFFNLLPISFFLLPILGVFGFLLFENRPQLQPMFIAFFLTIGFGVFSLGAGIVYPIPSRFLPAFGISFAFLMGILIVGLIDFIRASPKLKQSKIIFPYRRWVAFGLIGLIFALIIFIIGFSSRNFWELAQTQVLGLTTDQTVGIWDIKEKTSRLESLIGYTISGLTALGVAILRTRLGM